MIAAVAGGVVLLALTWLVYRDARSQELDRPRLWAGLVFATGGIALVTYLLVDTVPIPGLLVIAIAGPAFYLFERDDARHGDEPADPHVLPDGPADEGADDTSGDDRP